MGKDWALPTAKSPEKGKGWYNSTADDNEPETKLLKDDIEDEDEDSSHASAGSLQAMARSRKVYKSHFHLNLLERRHKVAWGALRHVDIASEE